jgi:DNA invertase Pin-like site-specific DNA recombinase
MMLSLEQNGHGLDTLIIEKLDRLSRDLVVQESIIRDFKSHGFNLVSAL